MLLANLQQDVDLNGFSIVPQLLDSDEIDSLLDAISDVQEDDSVRRILNCMLAVRIHLDDCNEQNGALRALPATHRLGRLTSKQIQSAQRERLPVTCSVARGGALLMKPLILHASSASEQPSHRRVIHIDFASVELPGGLRWLTGTAPQTI